MLQPIALNYVLFEAFLLQSGHGKQLKEGAHLHLEQKDLNMRTLRMHSFI